MGIGFATPINLSKFVVEQLKSKGKVERGWLGLKVMDNNENIAISDKHNFNKGVVISSVLPNSPCAKENIQVGDIIISVNGKDIKNAKSFSRQIAESKIGSDVILRVWQNMQTKDINLKIAQMPDVKNKSVIIDDILSDSDMYTKGLKSGDIIQKINDKEVTSLEDVKAYVDYAVKNNDDMIKIDILSDKLPQTIKVSIKSND